MIIVYAVGWLIAEIPKMLWHCGTAKFQLFGYAVAESD